MIPAAERMRTIANEELGQGFKRYVVRLVAEGLGSSELTSIAGQFEIFVSVLDTYVVAFTQQATRMRAGEEPPPGSPATHRELTQLLSHYRLGEELRKP